MFSPELLNVGCALCFNFKRCALASVTMLFSEENLYHENKWYIKETHWRLFIVDNNFPCCQHRSMFRLIMCWEIWSCTTLFMLTSTHRSNLWAPNKDAYFGKYWRIVFNQYFDYLHNFRCHFIYFIYLNNFYLINIMRFNLHLIIIYNICSIVMFNAYIVYL